MRLFIFSHAQDLESICKKFIKYLRYYLTSFSDVSIETVLLISIKITDFAHPNILQHIVVCHSFMKICNQNCYVKICMCLIKTFFARHIHIDLVCNMARV